MASMRPSRFGCLAMAWVLVGIGVNAYAGDHGATPSIAAFEHAQGLRQALEAKPESQRSRAGYERVLNAYRSVYHSDPGSARADDSIVAVAELLAEEGRVFHSPKAFRDAIGQYEFLRSQYPYSHYRFAALLTEGEIDQTDLADRRRAKTVFKEFLKKYPGNDLAGQARADLAAILKEESLDEAAAPQAPALPARAKRKIATASRQGDEGSPASQTAAALGSASSSKNPPPPDVAASASVETANDAITDQGEAHDGPAHVTAIHYWSSPSDTRIAINLEERVKYVSARIPRPNRIYFDLRGARLERGFKERSIAVEDDSALTRIRAAQFSPDVTRIVLDVAAGADYEAFYLPNPWRLIVDIHNPKEGAAPLLAASKTELSHASAHEIANNRLQPPASPAMRPSFHNELDGTASVPLKSEAGAAQNPFAPVASLADSDSAILSAGGDKPLPAREAEPTADGERSLARTLGLKVGRIVIDAGHGGHDSGTIGPGGLEEKNITLDVALRLGRLLKNRLGADVIYTRRTDTFIPLQTRTAIANAAHADLFISIHANSSSDDAVRGVESYYLNFTTAPDALEVAARENADSDESIANLSDLVKEITLKDKIEESREFAADVQQALYSGLAPGNPGFKNRGVKKAPFVVLIGANMPSILAEISFLTNPKDARELREPAYRERIAESLYRGVASYIDGLNGVRLAENGVRPN